MERSKKKSNTHSSAQLTTLQRSAESNALRQGERLFGVAEGACAERSWSTRTPAARTPPRKSPTTRTARDSTDTTSGASPTARCMRGGRRACTPASNGRPHAPRSHPDISRSSASYAAAAARTASRRRAGGTSPRPATGGTAFPSPSRRSTGGAVLPWFIPKLCGFAVLGGRGIPRFFLEVRKLSVQKWSSRGRSFRARHFGSADRTPTSDGQSAHDALLDFIFHLAHPDPSRDLDPRQPKILVRPLTPCTPTAATAAAGGACARTNATVAASEAQPRPRRASSTTRASDLHCRRMLGMTSGAQSGGVVCSARGVGRRRGVEALPRRLLRPDPQTRRSAGACAKRPRRLEIGRVRVIRNTPRRHGCALAPRSPRTWDPAPAPTSPRRRDGAWTSLRVEAAISSRARDRQSR